MNYSDQSFNHANKNNSTYENNRLQTPGDVCESSSVIVTLLIESDEYNEISRNLSVERNVGLTAPEVSISAQLLICKEKLIGPYFRIMSLLGWRPLFNPINRDGHCFLKFLNAVYLTSIIVLIILGHIMQYASCFRRDGFQLYRENVSSKVNVTSVSNHRENFVCSGGIVSTHVIPKFLHLCAYFCMFYQLHSWDIEPMQKFMETVFLQAEYNQGWQSAQSRLLRKLRRNIGIGFIWLVISSGTFVLQMMYFKSSSKGMSYTWMEPRSKTVAIMYDYLLGISTMINDTVWIVIAVSYCCHCKLLLHFLDNLTEAIRMKTIKFRKFYKEIAEAGEFLTYLNNQQSPGISFLVLHFCIKITTSVYGLVSGTSEMSNSWLIFDATAVLISYWCIVVTFPIYMAVRVTNSCSRIRQLGHEVRARAGYYDDPIVELDSFLLYMTSLKMHAKIFRVTVRSPCVVLAIFGTIFSLLAIGQMALTFHS